jgi:autotransporter-associated beta strand protein
MKTSILFARSAVRSAQKLHALCLTAVFALVAGSAHAQLISSESFGNYTTNAMVPNIQPSPTVPGFTGNWTSVDFGVQWPTVTAGSLNYTGSGYAASSGNHIRVPNNTSGGEITSANSGRMYRLLNSSLAVTGSTTGTRYMSWLFQSGQETGATTYQMLELYNGSTADAARAFSGGIGNSASQYNFQVNSASAYTSTGLNADTAVHLFVVKFNLSATAGADSVTVWIDPTLGAGDPAGGTTISGQNIVFDRLATSDYDGNSANWGDIRWGTTFDSVTTATPLAPPTVAVAANPTSASINQAFTITATVTPGAGTVTNATINLSQIGGSTAASLVLSNANVFTNTFTVPGTATLGVKTFTVAVLDTAPFSGSGSVSFTVLPSSRTWNGGSLVDSKWSSVTNWVLNAPPASPADSVTFAGTTRLTPDMNANYSIAGLSFDNTAGSFNISSSTGGTLTNGLSGIANNSVNPQVLNMPVVLGTAQTFNPAAGNLTLSNSVTGGFALTKSGNGTLTFSGSGTSSVGDLIVTNGLLKVTAGTVRASATQGNSKVDLGGSVEVSGGSLQITNGVNSWLPIGDTSGTTNTLTISGGAVIVNDNWGMEIPRQGTGILNLNSGSLTVNDIGGVGLIIGDMATAASGTVNLNGGTLTASKITSANGVDVLYFNGGTLSPTVSRTDWLNDAATLAVEVRNNGAVVDTAGFNVSIGEPLQHSTVGGDNATDGGLTKVGNGILTLSGGYAYTGPTKVLGGTLKLNPSLGVPASGGDLTVSNSVLILDATSGSTLPAANVLVRSGATLTLTNNPGANAINGTGNLTLSGGTTLNLNYGTLGGNPSAAAINVAGNFASSGTNVINIIAAGTMTVGQFPLIDYTGTPVPTNGFVLGALPAGINAVLTNNADNTSLDLLITLIGNTLSWHGANADNSVVLTNWDINSSANWYDTSITPSVYMQYSGNTIGDIVTFGDYGYNLDGTNAVNLAGRVIPASVTADSSTSYRLTGIGGIDGSTSFVKNNGNTFLIGTSNNFTGGTFVNAGTLAVANKSALGSGSVTLAGGTLQFAANITNANSVTVTVNSTLDVPTNVIAQMSGAITGAVNVARTGSGNLTLAGNVVVASLTKSDNGTLTLSGNSTFTGAAQVAGGTLNLTGSVTPGYMTVGSASGDAMASLSGNLSTSNLFVGNVSGAVGALRQTGGTLTLAGGAGDLLNLGNWDNTYGYYNAAGGTLNTKGISVGGGKNTLTGQPWPPAGSGASGLLEINGTTIHNDTGWVVLARGGGSNLGVLNLFSGSLSYADGGLGCNWQTTGASQTSIINVLGGTLTNAANVGINLNMWNTAGQVGILNLNGGLVQASAVVGNPGTVNFNGGTLRASTNSAAFVNVGAIFVNGGGAKIDDGGNAITIANPLSAPAGDGVSGILLTDGGSGYIAPPIVTITGGTGSNATAIATISGGVVTGITVTSSGSGYDVSDVLTVNFTGGGAAAVAPTVGTVSLAASISGGLTKTGNGTLTLNGVNTYTGPTVVSAGTLGGTGTIAGALTNNATLAPGNGGIGTLTINGNLTLNAGSTNLFEVNGTMLAKDVVVTGGAVKYGGVLQIAPAGTFTNGQQFVLFSGAGAANAGNFASLQGSPGSGLGFTFTNGVLSVVTTGPSGPGAITSSVTGGGSILSLSWPAGQGWRLQMQTNNLTTGLGTNWTYITDGSLSSTNITIDPTKPTVFYRLTYP